ncbi:PREDICTED: MICOS complex subunit MIC25 isoform X3 [Corvus brachyrhynchos]|nr:PREDICTED: MICOS complex subunit MIC25 isoform X3 [Corvus brachyrhynchos]
MKESSQGKRDYQRSPRASNGTAPSSLAVAGRPRPTGIRPPMASDSAAEQELYRRYEQEQALVQEELIRLAKREREAASEAQERNSINEERQRTAQLNAEIYKLTSEQYQEAATKAEERIKRRNTDPVCANLQSEILKCYRENKREALKCSELAKEYQRCVNAAQKELFVNSG